VVSFLPVFTMIGAEGKLFKPLAFTKTFALIASVVVALTIIPPLAHLLFTSKRAPRNRSVILRSVLYFALVAFGVVLMFRTTWWMGAIVTAIGLYHLVERWIPAAALKWISHFTNIAIIALVGFVLTDHWMPLGPGQGMIRNFLFVAVIIGGFIGYFRVFLFFYPWILRWCLRHKLLFLSAPLTMIFLGAMIWLGFDTFFGWLPQNWRQSTVVASVRHRFPGLGKEFMPPLDEGSYLFMPTTMPHASIGEALEVLSKQDMGIKTVPEIDSVVGKLGRVDSPLDPAPISMFETVINYQPEFLVDRDGNRLDFRFDATTDDHFRTEEGMPVAAPDGRPYKVRGRFERDADGRLIADSDGIPFRLWRPPLDPALNEGRDPWPGIRNPDDIWKEILKAAELPGTTSAPKLQPIAARLVMLQSGMRAPMGIKVKGPTLQAIEKVGFELEQYLKQVPSIEPATVIADRIVGKPYLEVEIDRQAIARYGIQIQKMQEVIEVAIGGKQITTTVEGRERYPVRVRYLRELRDSMEALEKILIPAADGSQIPLIQLADIRYVRGPQAIKSEDTFLVGYVIFDKKPGFAEVDVVEQAQAFLNQKRDSGEWQLPAGVSTTFAGNYENQIRAQKKLAVVLPLALFIIFMILYLQFRAATTTLFVFSGILVAWAGGFIMIWCYGQPWFFNFQVFGTSMRDLFQMHPVNLSVAIWVGFLALFGIASDDGVLIATFIDESFANRRPTSLDEIRQATLVGARRRIRAALMTSATTILALIPVLTSTGRGADIMVPMAIPSFGGMLLALVTVFVVPVLYCAREELKFKFRRKPESA